MISKKRTMIRLVFCSAGFHALLLVSCGDGLMPEPTRREPASETSGILETLGEFSEIGTIPQATPTLPVRWRITDLEGRTIDATIIGKKASIITLVRTSDGKRFELAIARLSTEDQKRIGSIPDATPPSRHPTESAHYRMGQAKLDELDARIAEVTALYSSTDSKIQMRSAYSELNRLKAERQKLMEDLNDLGKF